MIRFKYSELSTWLRKQIESGALHSGEKIPTETELSERFSISRDTVRKGLAVLEKENLLYKVKGSGTYVRKASLQDGTEGLQTESKAIGVVMNDIDNYIFPDIIKGINAVLLKNGYHAAIHFTNNRVTEERLILKEMMAGDFAGYIIEPTKSGLFQVNFDLYQKIANLTPAVLIHAKIPTLPIDAITMGDEQAGFKLTSFLLKEGRKNIVFIGKFDDQTGLNRYLGYVKAYQSAKYEIPDDNIFWCASEDIELIFQEQLSLKMQHAIRNSDAVICQDDRMACALKHYMQEAMPGERSVVCGFDDSEIAERENIISVAHQKYKFGEYAANRLLDKIKDPSINISYDFNPKLVVR